MTRDELMDYHNLLNDVIEIIEEVKVGEIEDSWNYDVLIKELEKLDMNLNL